MVSPNACGIGSLFCSPLGMDEESRKHLLDKSVEHPAMTCRIVNTSNYRKSNSCDADVSRSSSTQSNLSTSYSTRTGASDNLGERVVVARPGLVIVRDAESICINTVPTSNPSIMLFYPDRQVLAKVKDKITFTYLSSCRYRSPLAVQLLKLSGVEEVVLTSDYVAVKKICHRHKDGMNERFCSVSWKALKPEVLATMLDFFASGSPVLEDESPSMGSLVSLCEGDTCLIIRDLIDSRIRPMVQHEGGDVTFVGYDEDSHCVSLSYEGTCASSQSAIEILRKVILQLLQFYVPEVSDIIQVPAAR